jgi:hypothetical protein
LEITNAVALGVGYNHDLVLRKDGSVTAWGVNGFGQLDLPPDLTNVVSIAAGGDVNLTRTAEGNLVCWGRRDFGQLAPPPGLTNIVALAAGCQHDMVMKRDGTVAVWGTDSAGQCNVPWGLSNVVAIAAGLEDSLVLVDNQPAASFVVATDLCLSNGTFLVTVASTKGKTYCLEYKDALEESDWKTLPPSSAEGESTVLLDANTTGPARFYRVRKW